MSIESSFQSFLEFIEPKKTHIEEAKQGHETLRKRLETDDRIKDKLVGSTFLAGSYRRHTAVKPIKDVDVFIPASIPETSEPEENLVELHSILRDYYPTADLSKQRRSIKIELSYITMDVVIARAPLGADGILYVPDRELRKWVATNPKGHTEWVQELNSESSGNFTKVVKTIKWWRKFRLPDNKHPKSFFLECMVGAIFPKTAGSFSELVFLTFEKIQEKYSSTASSHSIPTLWDPGLVGTPLNFGITPDEFRTFYEDVQASVEVAQLALESQNPNDEWRKLFGEAFPKSLTAISAISSETIDLQYNLRISARLAKYQYAMDLDDYYPNSGRKLPKNYWLRFKIELTNVPAPYEIRWIVENHGKEAADAKDLSHFRYPGENAQWERTEYSGSHFMFCEILKNGTVVARTKHVVNIN